MSLRAFSRLVFVLNDMDGCCWPPYSVFFIDFWWCEGSGASFECLRMRHRSRRKCAPMNAGDLGSRWAVCACAYDPIHVTGQDKRLGPNCACVPFVTRFYAVRSLKLCEQCGSNTCVCVLFPMGSREHSCPNMGFCDVNESRVLNAWFWLVEKIFASLWLVSPTSSLYHYFQGTL